MKRAKYCNIWLRISENYRLANVEEILYHRYDHSKTISRMVARKRGKQRSLMLNLAAERARFGSEMTDWRLLEARIVDGDDGPGPDEYDLERFARARKKMARGMNAEARAELSKIGQIDMRARLLRFMTFLPRSLFNLRDELNDHRYYTRRSQRK